jgi:hypothetical protein
LPYFILIENRASKAVGWNIDIRLPSESGIQRGMHFMPDAKKKAVDLINISQLVK